MQPFFNDDLDLKRANLLSRIGERMTSLSGKKRGRSLGRRLGGRFDPNAIDGDGDGLVQEGTNFERPVTPRSLPKVPGTGGSRKPGESTKPAGLAPARRINAAEFDLLSVDNPAPPPPPDRKAGNGGEPPRETLSQLMRRLVREEGGFTIRIDTEQKETEGLSVAIPSGDAKRLIMSKFKNKDDSFNDDKFEAEIKNWLNSIGEQFSEADATHYGGWGVVGKDGEVEELHLEPATVSKGRGALDDAIRSGRQRDQIAIWDIDSAEMVRDLGAPDDDIWELATIPTGGTNAGQSTEGPIMLDGKNLEEMGSQDLQDLFNAQWMKASANPSPENVKPLLAMRNALFKRGIIPYYGLEEVQTRLAEERQKRDLSPKEEKRIVQQAMARLNRKFAQMWTISKRGKKQLTEPLRSFMTMQVKSFDAEAHGLLPDPLAVPSLHLLRNQMGTGIDALYPEIVDDDVAEPVHAIACRTNIADPVGSLTATKTSLFSGDPKQIAVKAFALAADSQFIKSGLVSFRSPVGRDLNAAASYLIPGDASIVRSPGRSIAMSAVTPGGGGIVKPPVGGGIGGGGIGRQIGQSASAAVRCPTGYQFGGRFSNRQLANCGQQLFDAPGNVEEPGGKGTAIAKRVERTLTGKPIGADPAGLVGVGFIKPGERGKIDATISRMAQIPSAGAANDKKAAEAIKNGIAAVGSSPDGFTRLVRRDGFALDSRVPVAKLAAQRKNRDLLGGTVITKIKSPNKIGADEVNLLGAGVSSIRLVAPGGQEIRLDRTPKFTNSDMTAIARQWSAVRRGLNGEEGAYALQKLAERSNGKLKYSEKFNNIDRPNESVRISRNGQEKTVPRWVYESFYASNAPGRSENDEPWKLDSAVASAGSNGAAGTQIDTIKEAVAALDGDGTLADIPAALRNDAVLKAKNVDVSSIGNGRSLVTGKNGDKFVMNNRTPSDAFGDKITADLQQALGINTPEVLLGKNGSKRSTFSKLASSAVPDGELALNASLKDASVADLANIALADFVLGRTNRNPGSISMIRSGNKLVPVATSAGSSEFMQGGKLSSQKLAAAISRKPEELLASTSTGGWVREFNVDPSVTVRKILVENLDNMVKRISDFDWKAYMSRLSADGDLSIADKQHVEFMRRLMDVRAGRLRNSKKTMLRLLGADD